MPTMRLCSAGVISQSAAASVAAFIASHAALTISKAHAAGTLLVGASSFGGDVAKGSQMFQCEHRIAPYGDQLFLKLYQTHQGDVACFIHIRPFFDGSQTEIQIGSGTFLPTKCFDELSSLAADPDLTSVASSGITHVYPTPSCSPKILQPANDKIIAMIRFSIRRAWPFINCVCGGLET